jgi:hypothetical protein
VMGISADASIVVQSVNSYILEWREHIIYLYNLRIPFSSKSEVGQSCFALEFLVLFGYQSLRPHSKMEVIFIIYMITSHFLIFICKIRRVRLFPYSLSGDTLDLFLGSLFNSNSNIFKDGLVLCCSILA